MLNSIDVENIYQRLYQCIKKHTNTLYTINALNELIKGHTVATMNHTKLIGMSITIQ